VAETFTVLELADVELRPGTDRVRHLAVRYAAKEAFIKAWSSAARGRPQALEQVALKEIEVVTDARRRPSLRLHGRVRDAVETLELSGIHVSLSHDGGVAAAVVLVERD
jgi:holo-[acyl-carrier protein] synthase